MNNLENFQSGNNGRLYFLDNIKAFAIIMVIWGHCGLIHDFSFINDWCYSFHVPIFFLVSGYLVAIKCNKTNSFFPNFRLLIPYFFFSAIYAIVVSILEFTNGINSVIVSLKHSLIRIMIFDGQIATWYIPCLIAVEIIYWIEVKKLKAVNCIIINFIICIIISFVQVSDKTFFLKVLFRIFPALLSFSAGVLIEKYKKEINVVLLFVLFAISFLMVKLVGNTNMYLVDFGKYPILYGILIILSSLSIFFFFKKFIFKNILGITWFGQNTLIVLGTHQSVIYLLNPIIGHFNIKLPQFIPTSMILTIIVILIEIPIILIINRWFKWTLGLKLTKKNYK